MTASSEASGLVSLQQAAELASAAHEAGDVKRAIQIYDQMLPHAPNHPGLLLRRGVAARETGDAQGAIAFLRRAAEQAPGEAEVLSNLANALGDVDDPVAAEIHLRAASLAPTHGGVVMNAAACLQRVGRVLEAVPLLRDLVGVDPSDPERWASLGRALHATGAFGEAAAAFRRALALRPDHPPTLTNLGQALLDGPEALAMHERALAIDPDFVPALGNRAASRLRAGDFKGGWEDWARRHAGQFAGRPEFAAPLWRGEALEREDHLLLWSAQGLGDVILALRYLPSLRRLAPRTTIELHPGLGPLVHGLPDGFDALERGAPLPRVTRHLPTASLPALFPQDVSRSGYLSAPPTAAARWAARISDSRPKIGLIWAGDQGHPSDFLRSLRLADLSPLLRRPGIAFHSLQKGPARGQIAQLPDLIVDHGDQLTDFGETAAAMQALDLVISVDTSGLNLAGALGLPAWGLLPPNPDWRWGARGERSVWHPSLRLFRRQRSPDGDSEPVSEFVARLDQAFDGWLRERLDSKSMGGLDG